MVTRGPAAVAQELDNASKGSAHRFHQLLAQHGKLRASRSRGQAEGTGSQLAPARRNLWRHPGLLIALVVQLVLLASPTAALSRDEIREYCAGFPNSTLTIGMITRGSTELVLQRWRPTFETYLSEHLASYGCATHLVPLQFDDYDAITAAAEIDFVFPNPTAFQELKDKYGVHEFLSVKRNFGVDMELDRFGGVIARAADRHAAIHSVADILTHGYNLTVCAVNPNAFGGWHIQWVEMLRAGVDVDNHFASVDFLGNHNDPLRGLLSGRCDLGIARTETIERLVGAGEFNDSQIFTIGDRGEALHFPQHLTTPLYPEWPLASLSHVPRDLEQLIAVPLLTLKRTDPEAIEGNHAGFAFPYSYEPVRDLLLAIDHYGTGECEPGQFRQAEFPRQCEACPAGTYNENGFDGCVPCPLGFANNATGNTDCSFCPEGLTTLEIGSTPDLCVVPPALDAAKWNDPGTWVNLGIGGVAFIAVVGAILYARSRSGSLLIALELFARGVLPEIVLFCMELSDLASDVACAIAILFITSLVDISDTMRAVYVAAVCAHIVPSCYNLAMRMQVILHTVSVAKPTKKAQPAGHSAVKPTSPAAEDASLNAAAASNGAANEVSHPTAAALSADLAKGGKTVHSVLHREIAYLEEHVSRDRVINNSMLALLLGFVFEDLLMSIINVLLLWKANQSEAFRNHAMFQILALAAGSSLLNLGLKSSSITRWLIRDRSAARTVVTRLDAVRALEDTVDHASAYRIASVLQTHAVADQATGHKRSMSGRSTSGLWKSGSPARSLSTASGTQAGLVGRSTGNEHPVQDPEAPSA